MYEERLRKKSTINIITTWIDTVYLIVSAGLTVILYFLLSNSDWFFEKIASYITDVDPDSVTAGYEVLGGLGMGMLGMAGVILGIVIIVMLVIEVVLLLPCIITGIAAHAGYKRKNQDTFKKDAILKIIMNAIISVCTISTLTFGNVWGVVMFIGPILVLALNIYSLSIKVEGNVEV